MDEIDLPGLSVPENVFGENDTEDEIMFMQLKYLNKYITPDVFFSNVARAYEESYEEVQP